MKRLTKFLLKRFAGAARPYLQSYGLLRTSMAFNRSALVFEPGPGRILVLAPHMDDEILGCGGALALHLKAGATVHVAFMTDGRHGSGELGRYSGGARRQKEMELVATRKEEARRALALYDLTPADITFIDAEDGHLADTAWAPAKLRELLEKFRPDIVYFPFFLEQHPDHIATGQVLMEATRGTGINFQCLAYEVWTPLFPNCLVSIDSVVELKRQALSQYVSQLKDADYLHTGLALNAYRSAGIIARESRYVEAFTSVGLEQYRQMFDDYRRGH